MERWVNKSSLLPLWQPPASDSDSESEAESESSEHRCRLLSGLCEDEELDDGSEKRFMKLSHVIEVNFFEWKLLHVI